MRIEENVMGAPQRHSGKVPAETDATPVEAVEDDETIVVGVGNDGSSFRSEGDRVRAMKVNAAAVPGTSFSVGTAPAEAQAARCHVEQGLPLAENAMLNDPAERRMQVAGADETTEGAAKGHGS